MSAGLDLVEVGALVACIAPLLLLLVLALCGLSGGLLGERGIGAVTRVALLAALTGALTACVTYVATEREPVVLSYGTWFAASADAFSFDLAIDGFSLGFAVLALGICNVVAAFSFRYLHREPGFQRYFLQMSMFVVGLGLVALGGSIEVLFVGWELLGLSSALLVGFFHERKAPVENALRIFAVYRLGDAAMFAAAVLLHHWTGSGNLTPLFSVASSSPVDLHAGQSLAIALLLLVAVCGKSALWPFSGWLPRAMEGPTPSSAIYYGALSIHAGCFLLLRAQPLIAGSEVARAIVAAVGVTTSGYAAFTARVQTDVKSALSYAALTQVGIIVVEIALGLRLLAFVHLAGHAAFRVLQFLSAPNVLHDLHELEKRLGARGVRATASRPPSRLSELAYLLALERGFADALLDRGIVRPLCWLVAALDRFDRSLVGSRGPSSERRRRN